MFWTLVTNISLASFQLPSIKLLYLDPYNNTFGEEDWFVALCTVIICIISIILMFSMLGIVMFVKYGIDIENRTLLDEVISFAMITGIIMLLSETILMTYRNVFGPMPSIFVTQMLLNLLEVWPEQFIQQAKIQTFYYQGFNCYGNHNYKIHQTWTRSTKFSNTFTSLIQPWRSLQMEGELVAIFLYQKLTVFP